MGLDDIGIHGAGPGSSDATGDPGRRPGRARWIRTALITLATVLILGAVFMLVAPQVQKRSLRSEMPQKAAQAREAALPQVDASAAPVRAEVARAVGEPTTSVTFSTCWVDHTDAGWSVDHYNHRCDLTTVDFHELGPEVQLTGQPGPPGQRPYGLVNADSLAGATDTTSEGLPPIMYLAQGASATDQVADDWLLTQGVPAYAAEDAFASREVVGGAQGSLDPSRSYVVVLHEQRYLDENIGCRIAWPFCSSPV